MNDLFNSRELSNFIWIAVVIIALLLIPSVRKHIPGLVKSALANKLVISYLWMFAYMWLVVYGLSSIGLWNTGQLKNTIMWAIVSGFTTLFSVTKVQEKKDYFKTALKEIIKFTVLSEFIVGLFTFSLLVELIAVPVITFLVLLKVIAERDAKYAPVLKLINGILNLVGIFLLFYGGYHLITDFKKVATMATLFDFLTPIFLTVSFLPFMYLFSIYLAYDLNFALLQNTIKETSLRQYAKRMTLIHFNFKVKDLERWRTSLFVHPVSTRQEVKYSIEKIKTLKKIEKNPPEIPQVQGWSPYRAKDFLNSEDIETGHYKDCGEGEWMACSPYIQLNDSLISNNISYYVEGDSTVAKKLKLSLNVHSPEAAITAHQRFLSLSKTLYKNAITTELPKNLENALLNGKNSHHTERNINIEVRKNMWEGHKLNGYHMLVDIKIKD